MNVYAAHRTLAAHQFIIRLFIRRCPMNERLDVFFFLSQFRCDAIECQALELLYLLST